MIHGRRYSRPLSPLKKNLLQNFLPHITVDQENIMSFFTSSSYASYERFSIEIGFGSGEHLIHRAKEEPNTLFIGCEPYINGVASILHSIQINNIKNIRLFIGDARLLLETLPKEKIETFYILFPDPWPKKRHHKRRIFNITTLVKIASTLKNHGMLYFVTDHEDYYIYALKILKACSNYYTKKNKSPEALPFNHCITRYHQKALDAHRSIFSLHLQKNLNSKNS